MIFVRIFLFIAICGAFFACSEQNKKTEAMLRFEAVQAEQRELVASAKAILDNNVANDPINNLAHVHFAREQILQASLVFKRANISGVAQPNLDAVKNRIIQFQPILAKHAIELLFSVAGKTAELQEKLYELKSQSYAANQFKSSEELATYLGNDYNQAIRDCCLTQLEQIQPLLLEEKTSHYKKLRWLIHNVEVHQEQILAGDYAHENYLQTIQESAAKLNISE